MKHRLTAAWVGMLFLTAMAASITGNVLILSVVGSDDYLPQVAQREMQLRVAAVFMIVNSISVVGIGALIYQVLRQKHVVVAIGYLATRTVESVTLLFGVISVLSLLPISEEYAQAAIARKANLLSLAESAVAQNWYSYNIAMMFLGVGSLFFCYVLLQRKMVSAYLSILGIVGYSLLVLTSSLAILDVDLGLAVVFPVFLFEVILGVWLIAKGFNLSDHCIAHAE